MEFMLKATKTRKRTVQYFVLPHMNFNVPGHVWFETSVTMFGNVRSWNVKFANYSIYILF